MSTTSESGREALCRAAQALHAAGLAPGTSGNLSLRWADGLLITPSGQPYPTLQPADLVEIDAAGRVRAGAQQPSTELPLHRTIYAARAEVRAIVHTHSRHATALACARRGIPALHYLVAVTGGSDVPCAEYATFGSDELAAHALRALAGRKAALLANHGVVAVGASLDEALDLAGEVENLACQYLLLLAAGLEPTVLDAAEMERVRARFAGYRRDR
ncbi:MAG: class II aldolase [Gammaproteobacteria bacterium]|nr:class II aldolase [Gammaproteobacteria bacterium]